jgi:DNA-binding HxlR family transcriptional regulator
LWPVLLSIWAWERHWVPEQAQLLPVINHLDRAADFSPVLVCRSCGDTVNEKQITARWGPSGTWARSLPESATRRRSDSSLRSGRAGLFPQTMTVFGNRWAAALLIAALLGATRFSQFQKQLGAPPSSLAARLRVFCDNGVLTGSTEYMLTEKGRAFLPALVAALQWAQRWYHAPEGSAVMLTHQSCGQEFTGRIACDQCAGVLTGTGVDVE